MAPAIRRQISFFRNACRKIGPDTGAGFRIFCFETVLERLERKLFRLEFLYLLYLLKMDRFGCDLWIGVFMPGYTNRKPAQNHFRHKEKAALRNGKLSDGFKVVPTIGLEPTTYALRVRCTTSCATSAPCYCSTGISESKRKFQFLPKGTICSGLLEEPGIKKKEGSLRKPSVLILRIHSSLYYLVCSVGFY